MKVTFEHNEHENPQIVYNHIVAMVQALAQLEEPSFDGKLLKVFNAVKEIFNEDVTS